MNIAATLKDKRYTVLITLLAIDLVFLLLHVYNSVLIPDEEYNPLFSLVVSTSYSEKFQYLKWFLLGVAFLYLAIKRSHYHYLAWALIFLYLLLDDSLEIHETFGGFLVKDSTATAPFGLRMQDIGELLTTVLTGAVLFSALAFAYIKGNSLFKTVTKDMLYLFAILVFFGVVVDMVAPILTTGRVTDYVYGIIEDGGEMLIASVMVWYAYMAAISPKDANIHTLGSFFPKAPLIKLLK